MEIFLLKLLVLAKEIVSSSDALMHRGGLKG